MRRKWLHRHIEYGLHVALGLVMSEDECHETVRSPKRGHWAAALCITDMPLESVQIGCCSGRGVMAIWRYGDMAVTGVTGCDGGFLPSDLRGAMRGSPRPAEDNRPMAVCCLPSEVAKLPSGMRTWVPGSGPGRISGGGVRNPRQIWL